MTQRRTYFAILLLIAACTNPADKRLKELERRLSEAEKKSADLESRLAAQATELTATARAVTWHGARLDALGAGEGFVSCTDKGFAFVQTKIGQLLVSCEDVKQYGDGYQFMLRIGNPHAVTLEGFKIKVHYGPRASTAEEWQAMARERELSLSESLRPGSWNHVKVVVAPARAEEVALLGIKVEVNRVLLAR